MRFAIRHRCSSSNCSISAATGDEKSVLQGLIESDELDKMDVLDVLLVATLQIAPAEIVGLLEPLKPRLYSIASSLKRIRVKCISPSAARALRMRTAQPQGRSPRLSSPIDRGDQPVPVFVQPSHGFTVPATQRRR